jgi:hypothetical protein
MVLLISIVEFFFIHMAYSAIFPVIAALIVVVTRAAEREARQYSEVPAPVSRAPAFAVRVPV